MDSPEEQFLQPRWAILPYANLAWLPELVYDTLLKYLPLSDIVALSSTNRRMRDIVVPHYVQAPSFARIHLPGRDTDPCACCAQWLAQESPQRVRIQYDTFGTGSRRTPETVCAIHAYRLCSITHLELVNDPTIDVTSPYRGRICDEYSNLRFLKLSLSDTCVSDDCIIYLSKFERNVGLEQLVIVVRRTLKKLVLEFRNLSNTFCFPNLRRIEVICDRCDFLCTGHPELQDLCIMSRQPVREVVMYSPENFLGSLFARLDGGAVPRAIVSNIVTTTLHKYDRNICVSSRSRVRLRGGTGTFRTIRTRRGYEFVLEE